MKLDDDYLIKLSQEKNPHNGDTEIPVVWTLIPINEKDVQELYEDYKSRLGSHVRHPKICFVDCLGWDASDGVMCEDYKDPILNVVEIFAYNVGGYLC